MKLPTNILIFIWSTVIAVGLAFLILWLSTAGGGSENPIVIVLSTNTPVTAETTGVEAGPTATMEATLLPVAHVSTPTSAEPVPGSTPGSLDQPAASDGLAIGPWRDDSIVCDRNPSHKWVKIKGLNISGGLPPYDITFTQAGQTLAVRRVEAAGEVEFVDPVQVEKGMPVTVTFTFDAGRGAWEENLYYHYLNDPRCAN